MSQRRPLHHHNTHCTARRRCSSSRSLHSAAHTPSVLSSTSSTTPRVSLRSATNERLSPPERCGATFTSTPGLRVDFLRFIMKALAARLAARHGGPRRPAVRAAGQGGGRPDWFGKDALTTPSAPPSAACPPHLLAPLSRLLPRGLHPLFAQRVRQEEGVPGPGEAWPGPCSAEALSTPRAGRAWGGPAYVGRSAACWRVCQRVCSVRRDSTHHHATL